jgi:hypothetical protein
LASICGALELPLSQLLRNVSDDISLAELAANPVVPVEPPIDPTDGPSNTPAGVGAAA